MTDDEVKTFLRSASWEVRQLASAYQAQSARVKELEGQLSDICETSWHQHLNEVSLQARLACAEAALDSAPQIAARCPIDPSWMDEYRKWWVRRFAGVRDAAMRAAALKGETPCAKCKGVGAPWNNSASVPCPDCNGTGKRLPLASELTGTNPDITGDLSTGDYIRKIRGDE